VPLDWIVAPFDWTVAYASLAFSIGIGIVALIY
jgi:hypothetical protein